MLYVMKSIFGHTESLKPWDFGQSETKVNKVAEKWLLISKKISRINFRSRGFKHFHFFFDLSVGFSLCHSNKSSEILKGLLFDLTSQLFFASPVRTNPCFGTANLESSGSNGFLVVSCSSGFLRGRSLIRG